LASLFKYTMISYTTLFRSGTTIELSNMTHNGLEIAGNILGGIFHPDTELLFNFTTTGIAYLLLETVCIAFLGTIVGAILAVPLADRKSTRLNSSHVSISYA